MPSFQEFYLLGLQQLSLKQLAIGEHKGHRYLVCYLPRDTSLSNARSLLPSTAYFEAKSKEQAIEYHQEHSDSMTWLWYSGMENIKSITEDRVKGLNFSSEVGFDQQANSIEAMTDSVKETIDDYIAYFERKEQKTEAAKIDRNI